MRKWVIVDLHFGQGFAVELHNHLDRIEKIGETFATRKEAQTCADKLNEGLL